MQGRVEFRDVTFSYDPDRPLIESLSLRRRAGSDHRDRRADRRGQDHARQPHHAVLRARTAASITLDGRDISSIPRAELRSKIGMVLQDTWLFGGTIHDNIAYGNPDATEEQILEAARATYVDRFVHSLPDGYDTLINEEADNVSAGQKQLLTIARAFLADPVDPHPRRGDELGRHPHRGADPGSDERAAPGPHELRDRAPARRRSAAPTSSS